MPKNLANAGSASGTFKARFASRAKLAREHVTGEVLMPDCDRREARSKISSYPEKGGIVVLLPRAELEDLCPILAKSRSTP